MKHIDCRNHSLTDGSSYRSTLPVGSIRILHEVIARKPNQRFVSALCPCVHVCIFRNRQHFFCFLATVTIEKDLFHHIQFLDNIHHFLGRGCTWRIIQIEIYFSTPCFQKLFQCAENDFRSNPLSLNSALTISSSFFSKAKEPPSAISVSVLYFRLSSLIRS